MGAVFDGKTKVGRTVADPTTDHMLPNPGSLMLGAIDTSVALAGTIGVEGKLVHGDRWEQVDGSLTETTNVNVTTTITGNETRQVMGNEMVQVAGNVSREIAGNLMNSIIGSEIRSNVGVQNYTYVAPTTRMHAGERGTQEEGSFFESVHMEYQWHLFAGEINLLKTEQTITGLAYVLFKTELVSIETKVGQFSNGALGFHFETEGASNIIGAMKNKLNGMSNTMQMIDSEMGFRMKVPPESIPGVE